MQLTMTSRKAQLLKAQVEASRVALKKRVIINPNPAFVDIETIDRAQINAVKVSEESDDSEESKKVTEEGSVIVVAGN